MDPSAKHEAVPVAGTSTHPPGLVAVRCWGTRGSIPSPGRSTVKYGGNTSCVEFTAGDSLLILDAGTGIRLLGEQIRTERERSDATILLTHYHWDHIQGLPFFTPAYDTDFALNIYGPQPDRVQGGAPLANQMDPLHFPVQYDRIPASFAFSPVEEGGWTHDGVRIEAMRMRHPSVTFGYRLEAAGRTVVFVPDNEIVGGDFPARADWLTEFERFISDADVLIHDAMFTLNERAPFEGWGHSTYEETIDLSIRAGVKRLFFFHHAPHRTDAALDDIVERFRRHASERCPDLAVHAAAEGDVILI